MFPSTDIRLKRPKKSPFSYQHHKTLLPLDHNTNPKSSSATTTIKPLLIDSETTPIQSTSTNTVCTITVDTTTPTTTQTISTIHPTLPSMPPLPPTPVHKPTSQFPPSCSSTSPSHPEDTPSSRNKHQTSISKTLTTTTKLKTLKVIITKEIYTIRSAFRRA